MGGATKKRLCFAIECNSGMPLNRAIQEDTGDGTVHIIVPDLQATLSRKEIGMQEMRWQATIKQAKDFRSSWHANMSNPTACKHEPIMLNAAEPNEDSLFVADFQAQNNKDFIMQEMRTGEGSGTDISPLELSVHELIMSDGPVPNTDSLHAPDPQSQHMFDRYQSDPEAYLRSGQSFNGNTAPNENPEGMLGVSTPRGLTIDVDDVSSLELDAALSTSDYLPYSVWTNI